MVNFKKIFLILFSVMFVIIMMLSGRVQAADNPTVIAPATPTPTAAPITVNTPTPTAMVKPTQPPATSPSSKLPQTGIEDYTGLIIVVILLAGSSIIAYKKIKEN